MMESGNFKYVMDVSQIHRRGPMGVNTNLRLHTSENILMPNSLRQQSAVSEVRFLRCHKMLCFLACRVLGSSGQVHEIVENCKITASRNPPAFEYEGAFRSWLVRILIDEAIAIVRQRERATCRTSEKSRPNATDKVRDHKQNADASILYNLK
jgi:DNA-directed RNA polymerase specialized sigma24 family protein